MTTTGIASLGLALPSRYLDVRDLAALRGVDPDKFTKGLGCHEIALLGEGEDVVTLAASAAERALARWGGSPKDLGLVAVGTETAQDMSRPLSAFVADAIGLRGAYRSYETKHACYGGTVALRQALEWKASGAARGKAALVIASDVALYAPKDPGEPTQGAGAVAFIVDDASVAEVDLESHAWAEPAFDFWRPVGESFPRVDGPLSLACYETATTECFRQLAGGRPLADVLEGFAALCFHVPFPKMVKKGVMKLGEAQGWDEGATSALFESKVMPTMEWNRRTGNSYTAALWTSVAKALAGAASGTRVAAFSYGSGFGSELLTLTAGPAAAAGAWVADVEGDLARRERIDADTYLAYRGA
ncbi:MAG: hydroxymethylglutaryl-CoA synthase family protein [Myxococcales bacterium]|nr:hydroxymethylglutaryl-CoA synthase family protein [Myxococcales bacterium]